MNTTTLRGIFPERKPVHHRNFVRENIKHLKQMQEVIQESQTDESPQEQKPDKFKHVAPKVYSYVTSGGPVSKDNFAKRPASHNQGPKPHPFYRKYKYDLQQKIIHRGVQTERPEDVSKLYESGVLKYPTPKTKQSAQHTRDHGDAGSQNLAKNIEKLDIEEKQNHIKQNIKSIKAKQKREESPNPNKAPPNYQKGVVPKYIKERRDVISKPVILEETLSGLVLLPDEERKEYLRVARENYAALIKELNSMPVSNDTLKKRKRKVEIEDELKRLDEVIKIFQKPKVFVKADA